MSDDIYTDSLRKANEINRNLLRKLVETEQKLKAYESGHKGACTTCEKVGELNVELEKKLEKTVEVITECFYYTSMRDPDINTNKQACDMVEKITNKILKELGE